MALNKLSKPKQLMPTHQATGALHSLGALRGLPLPRGTPTRTWKSEPGSDQVRVVQLPRFERLGSGSRYGNRRVGGGPRWTRTTSAVIGLERCAKGYLRSHIAQTRPAELLGWGQPQRES